MNNLTSFIQSAKSARKANPVVTHANKAGAPSYYRSLKEQVIQILTTGTLGDTFYVSGKTLGKEALEVLLQARAECPEFLAKALIYARNEGLMKALPIVGLTVLSGGRGNKSNFEAIFNQVIRTPDDLRDFVLLSKSGVVPGRKGLGGVTRDAVRQWLGNLSEYHAVKYGSAASQDVTLRDILRLTHPKPQSETQSELFGWLVKGKEALNGNSKSNPQVRSLEALKLAITEEEQIALIRQGRLPFEVVIPSLKATTPAIWSELLHQAPYFNLLRNLVTFTRHNVFTSDENVRYAVQKLTDLQAVKRSKVLPFRFFDAWKRYEAMDNPDSRISDALRQALELSFVNMPLLEGKVVAIGTDTSGSMWGQINQKSATRYIDIAAIFTGALLRQVKDRVIPLPFDTEVYPNLGLSSRDEILTTAQKLEGLGGGGTAIGAPIQYLLDRKIKVDVFVGITDQEDWAYGGGWYSSRSFLDAWSLYRKSVAPEAKAYLITIAPYRDAVAPQSAKGIRFIYGWNDSVLKYISSDLEGGENQIQEIEKIQLQSTEE